MEKFLDIFKKLISTSQKSQHVVNSENANLFSEDSNSGTEKANYNVFLGASRTNKGITDRIERALSSANIPLSSINEVYNNLNGFSISITTSQANILESHFDIASIELDRIMPYEPPIESKENSDSDIPTPNTAVAENNNSDTYSDITNKFFGIEPFWDNNKRTIESFDLNANSSLSANALSSYGNTIASSGEILPYGVRAVWKGKDVSLQGNMGSGNYAFVIDSGVLDTTGDLNLNKSWSKSWVNDEGAFEDGNGHGTHVSGTIAALANGKGVVGVAPGAEVISLKVFNNDGDGASYSTIIDAINYAAGIIINNSLDKSKVVINMSLGGPFSQGLDQAVKNVANQGIRISVAAGNSAADADTVSPASAGDH